MAKIMMKLFIIWYFMFSTIINHSISARILDHQSPFHHTGSSTHDHHPITFIMQDHTMGPIKYNQINTTDIDHDHLIPFPRPDKPNDPPAGPFTTGSSSTTTAQTDHHHHHDQTLDDDLSAGIGTMSFPALAALPGLTLGTVTAIDEMLMAGHPLLGFSVLVGKARGVYVASSPSSDEDGNYRHLMMAMNVLFSNGDYKDGLKLFGVVHLHHDDHHQPGVTDHGHESHIAVIGGTGKYAGANGYATVKAVSVGIDDDNINNGHEIQRVIKKFLLFTLYLS